MKFQFADRADNVFLIDAGMFGFERYMSAFLVKGEKLALVDTGLPDSLERVKAGINSHGFSVGDIDYIFVTHEHHDHSGNLGPLLRENPNMQAYIHPLGADWVMDPSQEDANRKKNLSAKMAKRFAPMEPVPASRLNTFNDGDVFDLGDGERLRVVFTPGHQPAGVVIAEEKHKGLFINDLVGNCFADCDFQLILNPPRSNLKVALAFLKQVQGWDVDRLFLGHFGISETPKKLIDGAIASMQEVLDIGARCSEEGGPDRMRQLVYEMKMKEVEKLRSRGEELYLYMRDELCHAQAGLCTEEYFRSAEQG